MDKMRARMASKMVKMRVNIAKMMSFRVMLRPRLAKIRAKMPKMRSKTTKMSFQAGSR
jgi:hypothetical protein